MSKLFTSKSSKNAPNKSTLFILSVEDKVMLEYFSAHANSLHHTCNQLDRSYI